MRCACRKVEKPEKPALTPPCGAGISPQRRGPVVTTPRSMNCFLGTPHCWRPRISPSFDSTAGMTFFHLRERYRLSFWAKALTASMVLQWTE